MAGIPKRHIVVPDIQARPGVPLDHCDWVGEALLEYRPDTVINLGDTYDFPSLNGHEEPGSASMEGQRYKADLEAGHEAFRRISEPTEKQRGYDPRKVYLLGNHEDRADRAAIHDPKYLGHIGSENCGRKGWERHPFLEVVNIDGVNYSHYFSGTHSGRPIGGSVLNKLNKINGSFVHGHVQGLDMGTKMTPLGRTLWGVAAGSCYLHKESYRGRQGQRHWQGILVLNEVDNGEFCPMPLSLSYLCRKFTGENLFAYMNRKYPGCDWRHLQSGGLNEAATSNPRKAVCKMPKGSAARDIHKRRKAA